MKRSRAADAHELPPFPPRLVAAAAAIRASPDEPSPFASKELRDALCDYTRELRVAGIGRDRVIAAVWPAFVGIGSAPAINAALDACLEIYDAPVTADRRHPRWGTYTGPERRRAG